MGFANVWNRTLVYFGIAEDEEWDEDGLEQLSMGTSQDWRVAVEEGATLIRVGSTLFRPS